MNDHSPVPPNERDTGAMLGQLIARAGARQGAAESVAREVHAVVEGEWRAVLRSRRRTRVLRWALAASVAVVMLLPLLLQRTADPAPGAVTVGRIVAARGSVTLTPRARGVAIAVRIGAPIPGGARLRAGVDGSARIVMAGASVTVGAESELTLTDEARLQIQRGRIYVDGATDVMPQTRLQVATPFGSVKHLGTRFEVAVTPTEMRVRVREGVVQVLHQRLQATLRARDVLSIGAGGDITRSVLDPFAPDWAWTQDLAPRFEIEGRSLTDFLDWFSRISGYSVRFASATARSEAGRAILHGSIAGLSPREALTAVSATTRFEFVLTPGGDCRISMRGELNAP